MANYNPDNRRNERPGERRAPSGDSRQTRPVSPQSRDDRMRRPRAYVPQDQPRGRVPERRKPAPERRKKKYSSANASRIAILVLSCAAIILMIVICCFALSGGFSRNSGAAETTSSASSGETVNGGASTQPDHGTTAESGIQTDPAVIPSTDPPVTVDGGSETEFVSHPSQPHEGARIVVIDSGHGFADGGSTSDLISPLNEMDINMLIAQKLKAKLQAAGYTVVMTHESNEIPAGKPADYLFNKYDRRIFLEEQPYADFFVSIHCNAFVGTGTARGTRIYYCMENASVTPGYADKLSKAIYSVLPSKEPRIYPQETSDAFVVLQTRKCPAFLIEVGFITDTQDAANMITDAWQDQMAAGIAAGIQNCIGK